MVPGIVLYFPAHNFVTGLPGVGNNGFGLRSRRRFCCKSAANRLHALPHGRNFFPALRGLADQLFDLRAKLWAELALISGSSGSSLEKRRYAQRWSHLKVENR